MIRGNGITPKHRAHSVVSVESSKGEMKGQSDDAVRRKEDFVRFYLTFAKFICKFYDDERRKAEISFLAKIFARL